MKPSPLLTFAIAVLLAGCGQRASSPPRPTPTTPLEVALASWHDGDQEAALQRFLETDWTTPPLFTPGSPLALKESDLRGLSQAQLKSDMEYVMAQLADLKRLAAAVRDTASAAEATDPAFAKRCRAQLYQCGAALDRPDRLKIVQLVGRAVRQMPAPTPAPAR